MMVSYLQKNRYKFGWKFLKNKIASSIAGIFGKKE
jgi:hypothetical protein